MQLDIGLFSGAQIATSSFEVIFSNGLVAQDAQVRTARDRVLAALPDVRALHPQVREQAATFALIVLFTTLVELHTRACDDANCALHPQHRKNQFDNALDFFKQMPTTEPPPTEHPDTEEHNHE